MEFKKVLSLFLVLVLVGCGQSDDVFDINKQKEVDHITNVNNYYKAKIDKKTKSLKTFVQNEAWEQDISFEMLLDPGSAQALIPSANIKGGAHFYQTEDGKTIQFDAQLNGKGQEGGEPSEFSSLFDIDIDAQGRLLEEVLFLNFPKLILNGPDRIGGQNIELKSELNQWYQEPYADFLKSFGVSSKEIEEALNPDSPVRTYSEIMTFLSGITLLESDGPVQLPAETESQELIIPVRISNKSFQDTSQAFVDLLDKIYPMDADSQEVKNKLITYIQQEELQVKGTLFVSNVSPEDGHRITGEFLKKGEEGTEPVFYFSYNKTPNSYLFLISPEPIKNQKPLRFVSINYEQDTKFEVQSSHIGSLKVDLAGDQVSGTLFRMEPLIDGEGTETLEERRIGMFSFVQNAQKWNGAITIPGEIYSGQSEAPLKVLVKDFVFSLKEVNGKIEIPLSPIIPEYVLEENDSSESAVWSFDFNAKTKPVSRQDITAPSSSEPLDELKKEINAQIKPATLNDNLPTPTSVE